MPSSNPATSSCRNAVPKGLVANALRKLAVASSMVELLFANRLPRSARCAAIYYLADDLLMNHHLNAQESGQPEVGGLSSVDWWSVPGGSRANRPKRGPSRKAKKSQDDVHHRHQVIET